MIYFFWEWCKIDNLMWSILKKWVYKIKKVDSYTKIIINFTRDDVNALIVSGW